VNLVLTCPSCGNRLEIDEPYFGRKILCGGCKETIQVPRVEPGGPPVEADGASIRADRPEGRRREAAPSPRDRPPPLPGWPEVTAPRKGGWTPLAIVLTIVIGVLLVCGGGAVAVAWVAHVALGTIESSKEDIAKAQIMETLIPAVERYRLEHDDLPDSLQDLLQSDKTALKADQLIDPWGQTFQYSPESAHNAPDGFDIWTETPSGKMIGNWKP
jgi:hypothetical protein